MINTFQLKIIVIKYNRKTQRAVFNKVTRCTKDLNLETRPDIHLSADKHQSGFPLTPISVFALASVLLAVGLDF